MTNENGSANGFRIGPLDYLFLKKVVKKLELTWITFPTVVLVVSADVVCSITSLSPLTSAAQLALPRATLTR